MTRGGIRRQSTKDSRVFKMSNEDMANLAALNAGGGGLKEPEVVELIEKVTLKDREKIGS